MQAAHILSHAYSNPAPDSLAATGTLLARLDAVHGTAVTLVAHRQIAQTLCQFTSLLFLLSITRHASKVTGQGAMGAQVA